MSLVHVFYVGFFDGSSAYLDVRRVLRQLSRDDLTVIEQDVAKSFDRIVDLSQHVTPDGYLAFGCTGPYDWDDPYRIGLVGCRVLGAVAGERKVLSHEDLQAAVHELEARDAELKLVRALPTGAEQVAAVVMHVKGGGPRARLRWPYTVHAVSPGRDDTVDELARALRDDDAAVRAFAAESLGSFGAAAAPAVPALGLATTDRAKDVRRRAVGALGRIGSAAQPAVASLLKALESDPGLSWEATRALKAIGPGAVPALIELLGDPSGPARVSAAECLGELGPVAVSASSVLERVATREKGDRSLWRAARRAWRAVNPGVRPPPATGPDWVKG